MYRTPNALSAKTTTHSNPTSYKNENKDGRTEITKERNNSRTEKSENRRTEEQKNRRKEEPKKRRTEEPKKKQKMTHARIGDRGNT